MRFEWDPRKNQRNIATHRIDFVDAARVFAAPVLYTYRSDRHGEERYTAVGMVEGRLIAVAYTDRGAGHTHVRRIISARRAQDREGKKYNARHAEEKDNAN